MESFATAVSTSSFRDTPYLLKTWAWIPITSATKAMCTPYIHFKKSSVAPWPPRRPASKHAVEYVNSAGADG